MGIAKGYMETAPNLDLALLSDQDKTSFLYDTEGNVITDYKGTENRVMVSISAMPENLCNAFVAVEDARFYTHNGIDVKRIIGSFVTNFTTGSQQGGSTITQQLIKNTVLTSEQSYKRKIQEAYLAMQLESRYTKDADSGMLPEHHLPRRELLRRGSSRAGLLRQKPGRADAARMRHAGRDQRTTPIITIPAGTSTSVSPRTTWTTESHDQQPHRLCAALHV